MPDQMTDQLEEMTHAYAVCALWSSHQWDENGEDQGSLGDCFTVDDLTTGTRDEFRSDCRDFLEANRGDVDEMLARGFDVSQVGHDFWLTRNGHGAGFWDRGLGNVGERLSSAAKVYGGVDLFVVGGVDSPEEVSS